MKHFRGFTIGLALAAALLLAQGPSQAQAQALASVERQSIAIGHYARARALLVEALAEFERGRHVAQPDILVNAERWRASVISRAEELNRILDPQPRVTRSGVKYKANKALIRRDREHTSAAERPKDSNVYEETSGYGSPAPLPQAELRTAPRAMMTTPAEPKINVSETKQEPSTAPVETQVAAKKAETAEAGSTALSAEEEMDAETEKLIEAVVEQRLEQFRAKSNEEKITAE